MTTDESDIQDANLLHEYGWTVVMHRPILHIYNAQTDSSATNDVARAILEDLKFRHHPTSITNTVNRVVSIMESALGIIKLHEPLHVVEVALEKAKDELKALKL